MKHPHIILCGGTSGPVGGSANNKLVSLDLRGRDANVNLRISCVSEAMVHDVPDLLADILEVATYVFAADQACSRGGPRDARDAWHRRFVFYVPVRCPDVWSRPDVLDALTQTLSFLTDDDFEFVFSQLQGGAPVQPCFENLGPRFRADEVLCFSGGADSLAGVVQAALTGQRDVALVSHRSTPKRSKQIDNLVDGLRQRAKRCTLEYVPVWATKSEDLDTEFTQRSRSFLYMSAATAIASMLKLDSISFYENGVTSFNLPISGQVVGARATRTTHPRSIAGFARLFSLLLDLDFRVETPFLWRTKTDVLRLIHDAGCGDLLSLSVSCSHTREATKLHTHCGLCSQCLDRRFAALAAGMDDNEDPPEMYKVDLLTGERAFGEHRAMAQGFVERARLFRDLSNVDFFAKFAEVNRSLSSIPMDSSAAAEHILDLHRRHGRDVGQVLTEGVKTYAQDLQAGTLPETCILVSSLLGHYQQTQEANTDSEPTLAREAQYWRIWFQNERCTLKDAVGVHHLATLLSSPGKSIHCKEMLAPETATGVALPTVSGGDLSDHRTIKGVKARLAEVESLLAEKGSLAPPEELYGLQTEGANLKAYLARVQNHRGEPRRADDETERARQAVCKALRRTLGAIADHHPHLSRHLMQTLHLGEYCTYKPQPPLSWSIRR